MAAPGTNYLAWTPEDVANYFSQKGFREYANLWVKHKLSGERMVMLQPGDLQDMGITTIGDRIGIQKELRVLKSGARALERSRVLAEFKQGYHGSDLMKFLYENCGGGLCCPREADRYTVTGHTLKIRQYHIHRIFGGWKCGGCLGGVWKYDTIQLDRITDVDTEITTVGIGMMASTKCWVFVSAQAGMDAETQQARVENHQLFLEKEDGEKLAETLQHRIAEYKLELAGQHDTA
eukprot:CAMPEP_0204528722 /NCGR_PEP_ID=MMETSP0661-20131031/9679_1 /ASSEMBLY_ACC=CAM_ASM_000606 /TAXON_ID=109239 /ORGANISM="Alexandrium margalefi, Strain AMGDE01CS-322" /LENGTH=234 /DNA_ID=CAMNT_0051534715 /DNA_START=99 /DNA_END=803 /DNA_ORIENTATION=+